MQKLEDSELAPQEGQRGWWGGLLGAGVAVAVVVGVALSQPPRPPACAIDAAALEGSWGPQRRAAVESALLASGLSFAPVTASTVGDGLDSWARDWVEARRQACAQTRVEGVVSEAMLDRRMACLDRQRQALVGVVQVFEGGGAGVVARAPALLGELPDLRRCDRPRALDSRAAMPADPAQAREVLRQYESLARARARARVGALEQAEALSLEVAGAGEALDYPPLALEAHATQAAVALRRGDFEGGVELYREAIHGADALGLEALSGELSAELALGVAGEWGKPELEGWIVEEGGARLRAHDLSDAASEVALLLARGRLAHGAGRHAAALTHFEQARSLARATGRRLDAEQVGLELARAHQSLGRYDEAGGEYGHLLKFAQSTWGAESARVGDVEFGLATLALEIGDLDGAQTHLDGSEPIAAAVFGAGSLRVAKIRFARVELVMARGEMDTALFMLEPVIATLEAELGGERALTGQAHGTLGALHFYGGDYASSIRAYERALGIAVRVHGMSHEQVGLLYGSIGESRARMGDHEGALADYGRALDVFERVSTLEHPRLALPLEGSARSLLALGRSAEALPLLERALLLAQEGGEPLERADRQAALARALVESGGDLERARILAEAAQARYVELGMEPEAAALSSWLNE